MNEQPEWEELIDRHLRGELDESEKERLAERLDSDTSAREHFVEQVSWDTRMAEGLREKDDTRPDILLANKKPPLAFSRTLLAVAACLIVALTAGLVFQWKSTERPIARITAVSGSVQWTSDGGQVRTDLRVGTPIHGGVLETLTHDSWMECAFLDGTRVSFSGYSMATLSEHERQKILHLREGNMFADVYPQPESKPMRVITRTAEAEVLGTKFQVACEQQSTSLRVKEGLVQVRRLADGSTSKVPAGHVIVAALEQETAFAPRPHKEFITTWKASVRRDIGYGELRHAAEGSPASVYAKPLLWRGDDGTQKPRLLYVALLDTRTATPILEADSSIKVRGRLREDALVVFGFTANHSKGGFAGKYSHVKKRMNATGDEYFEVDIPLKDFGRDMGLEHYPESPVGLELHQCWILTLDKDYGLDIVNVELQNRDPNTGKGQIQ